MKINLGAGKKHLSFFKSIDFYSDDEQKLLSEKNLDFYSGDANEYLKNLDNDSIDEVYSRHFIEHLSSQKLEDLLIEIERVLKKDGKLTIIVPHWGNPFYYSDPTHKKFFGLYSIDYLTASSYFRRKVPTYSKISNLKTVKVRFNFITSKWLKVISIIANFLVNFSRLSLEIYESNLANIFPPYEIKYELIKN